MTSPSKTQWVAFGAPLLALLVASAAGADPVMRRVDADTVSITDFSGRPPFRRRIVNVEDLDTVDFARFEALEAELPVDADSIGDTVRVTEFRGKPPFRRKLVEIDASNVVEFARFEEVELAAADEEPSAAPRPRRRGAPGKSLPLRR